MDFFVLSFAKAWLLRPLQRTISLKPALYTPLQHKTNHQKEISLHVHAKAPPAPF